MTKSVESRIEAIAKSADIKIALLESAEIQAKVKKSEDQSKRQIVIDKLPSTLTKISDAVTFVSKKLEEHSITLTVFKDQHDDPVLAKLRILAKGKALRSDATLEVSVSAFGLVQFRHHAIKAPNQEVGSDSLETYKEIVLDYVEKML